MDNTRTVAATLILTVTADDSSLTITTTSLPTGAVKERYAAVMDAAGGKAPYTWTLLSGGGSNLSLSTAGILSGTPNLPGSFGLVFRVNDGTRTDVKALTLSITPLPGAEEPLNITTTSRQYHYSIQ